MKKRINWDLVWNEIYDIVMIDEYGTHTTDKITNYIKKLIRKVKQGGKKQ